MPAASKVLLPNSRQVASGAPVHRHGSGLVSKACRHQRRPGGGAADAAELLTAGLSSAIECKMSATASAQCSATSAGSILFIGRSTAVRPLLFDPRSEPQNGL